MKKKPKTLIWDIEKTWGGFDANSGSILCIGYKFLGDKKTHVISQWDFPGWKKDIYDDKKVIKKFLKIINEADSHVTHYGKKFDLPFLNSRALKHNLLPVPGKIKHIDTWYTAKYKFKFFSNRLDTVAEYFNLDYRKFRPGLKCWQDIMNRKKSACKKMADYCAQDVRVLEGVYKKILPLISGVPNYNVIIDSKDALCPKCGSDRLRKNGYFYGATKKHQRYHCAACGSSCTDGNKTVLRKDAT